MKEMRIPRSLLRRQTQANSTITIDFVHPKIAIQDSYYFPITVSNPEVNLRTVIANRIDQTWIPISAACDVIGPKASAPLKDFLDNCADGQRLDPTTSTTIKQSTSGVLNLESDAEDYYVKGGTGSDTIRVGNVELANFDMNFATETNTSFAHVGLGPDSTLLTRLKEEGHIAARAFSMFAGSDVSYGQDWDPNAKNASYPGNIVLGGYDFKKEGDSFLRGDLISGVPRVKITGIHVHSPDTHIVSMNTPLEAEIDTSNPFIYLPGAVANNFRSYRANVYNATGQVKNRIYGNVTMTVSLLGDARVGVTEFNVTLPESIWEKDRSYFRAPEPTKQKYWPVLVHNTAPAVLGLPFLKAIYLAINYDSNEFQISPASYSSETETLPFAAVAADNSNRLKSFPTRPDGSVPPSTSISISNSSSSSTPKSAIIGGAVGGVIALFGILGAIIFLVKKGKKPWGTNQAAYKISGAQPPSSTQEAFIKAELPADRYSILPSELPVPPHDHYDTPGTELQEVSASPVKSGVGVYVP